MLDKVMRAIAENQHQWWMYSPDALALCDPIKIEARWSSLRAAASAAIEAMTSDAGAIKTQRQDSLASQLRDLREIARKEGMYDAADLIGDLLNESDARIK